MLSLKITCSVKWRCMD